LRQADQAGHHGRGQADPQGQQHDLQQIGVAGKHELDGQAECIHHLLQNLRNLQ
jgi:hypothetical protein